MIFRQNCVKFWRASFEIVLSPNSAQFRPFYVIFRQNCAKCWRASFEIGFSQNFVVCSPDFGDCSPKFGVFSLNFAMHHDAS